MTPYLLIGAGGILGANARYLVSGAAANRLGVSFPYGTFVINVTGSFALAFLLEWFAKRGGGADAKLLIGTGFLGAYTTFSTFTYESVALIRQGSTRLAAINAGGSVIAAGLGAVGGIAAAALLDSGLS